MRKSQEEPLSSSVTSSLTAATSAEIRAVVFSSLWTCIDYIGADRRAGGDAVATVSQRRWCGDGGRREGGCISKCMHAPGSRSTEYPPGQNAAATPTRTGDTLHMHSVANTAKRRQKQKGQRKRGRDRADAELASAVDGQPVKRVLSAPPRDEPDDETEMT